VVTYSTVFIIYVFFIRYYVDDQIEKDEVGSLFGTYRRDMKYLLRVRCKFLRKDIFSKP